MFRRAASEEQLTACCSSCGPAAQPEGLKKLGASKISPARQASEDFFGQLSEAPLPEEVVPSLGTAAGAVAASQQAPPCSDSSYSPNPDPNKNEEK